MSVGAVASSRRLSAPRPTSRRSGSVSLLSVVVVSTIDDDEALLVSNFVTAACGTVVGVDIAIVARPSLVFATVAVLVVSRCRRCTGDRLRRCGDCMTADSTVCGSSTVDWDAPMSSVSSCCRSTYSLLVDTYDMVSAKATAVASSESS